MSSRYAGKPLSYRCGGAINWPPHVLLPHEQRAKDKQDAEEQREARLRERMDRDDRGDYFVRDVWCDTVSGFRRKHREYVQHWG